MQLERIGSKTQALFLFRAQRVEQSSQLQPSSDYAVDPVPGILWHSLSRDSMHYPLLALPPQVGGANRPLL